MQTCVQLRPAPVSSQRQEVLSKVLWLPGSNVYLTSARSKSTTVARSLLCPCGVWPDTLCTRNVRLQQRSVLSKVPLLSPRTQDGGS